MTHYRFEFSIREIGSSKIIDGQIKTVFYIEGPEIGQTGMRFDTINQADDWLHNKLKRNLK